MRTAVGSVGFLVDTIRYFPVDTIRLAMPCIAMCALSRLVHCHVCIFLHAPVHILPMHVTTRPTQMVEEFQEYELEVALQEVLTSPSDGELGVLPPPEAVSITIDYARASRARDKQVLLGSLMMCTGCSGPWAAQTLLLVCTAFSSYGLHSLLARVISRCCYGHVHYIVAVETWLLV